MSIMAAGKLKRVVALRLMPGEDLMGGIEEACNRYGIRHGCILSGIGSLNGVRFFDVEALPGKKAGYGYGSLIEVRGPMELISVSGSICEGADGEVLLHVHGCFSDKTGRCFAGHMIEGNKVLLTADVVIGEFEGISMDRRYDENLDIYLIHPREI